jgi:hypothetical protein
VSDDGVFHRIVPKTAVYEVSEEPGIDDLELSSQYTATVNVAVEYDI